MLRQNLSRPVIGEARGVEAGVIFEAMQVGVGTPSTTRSYPVALTTDRLAVHATLGGVLDVEEMVR